jgi:hypothetical protein
MTTDSTSDGASLRSERRNDLLELAEFLGLDAEADELRGDARTERILPRLDRALRLAGLPISTGGPGVTVTLLPAAAGWPAGSVAVEWNVGADLDALGQDAIAGDTVDRFTRSIVTSMEAALGAILRQAGLRILTDSQFSGVIVADTRPLDGAEVLGL